MKIRYFIYFFSQTVHKTYVDIMFFSPKISFEVSNRVFWLQTKISSFIQILSLKHIGCLLGRSPPLSASPLARLHTPARFNRHLDVPCRAAGLSLSGVKYPPG